MAETTITFDAPGVQFAEHDFSQASPLNVSEGDPLTAGAAILGVSKKGPAYVPVGINTYNEFVEYFGEASSEHFGSIAAKIWLNHSPDSLYFVRLLGVGDGKKRNASGTVTNAGFSVGGQTVQGNGNLGNNTYANHDSDLGNNTREGRTHFLGCFMSESDGSTVFSSAGVQQHLTPAVAGINCVDNMTGAIIIEDGARTRRTYHFTSGTTGTATVAYSDNGGRFYPAGVIVNTEDTDGGVAAATIASEFITALADTDAHAGTITGGTSGVLAHITQSVFMGPVGNTYIDYHAPLTLAATRDHGGSGTAVASAIRVSPSLGDSNFKSGSGGAAPILRGVLLSASGVLLTLSSSALATEGVASPTAGGGTSPLASATAVASGIPRAGSLSGSVVLTNGESSFRMHLCGYNNVDSAKRTVQLSFDPESELYFPKILNKDPLKLEEEGHYLHTWFDVYSVDAAVTGSGILAPGNHDTDGNERIAFMLTGAHGRSSASSTRPDYEDFQDSFSSARSPWIVSQDFGGDTGRKNLFRFHSVNDGESTDSIKISIKDLTIYDDDFTKFTVEVYERDVSDLNLSNPLISKACSLDPDSDIYIGRMFGDQNPRYIFNVDEDDQRFVIDGDWPITNGYIRVEIDNAIKNKEYSTNTLKAITPFGYRGSQHLVLSGTNVLSSIADSGSNGYGDPAKLFASVTEPPIPYRQKLPQERPFDYYWGFHIDKVTTNSGSNLDLPASPGYSAHFPTHRTDVINFAIDNKDSLTDSAHNSDNYHNNLFALDKIKIKIDSTTTKASTSEFSWSRESTYQRRGGITNDGTYRAFAPSDLTGDGSSNRIYAKFMIPMYGGFDGLNIFNKDQFLLKNNAAYRERVNTANLGGENGSTNAAYLKGLDVLAERSNAQMGIIAMPGINIEAITNRAIEVAETRFDSLYLMDVEKRNSANVVITGSATSDPVDITYTTTAFNARGYNTSFAAAFYNDVVISVTENESVSCPASIGALAVIGLNDTVGFQWLAPAGETRGKTRVIEDVEVILTDDDEAKLFEASVNPITTRAATPGPVVFGQKTLSVANNALNRINVRRLLIFIRREIRKISEQLIFEPHQEATLEKFREQVKNVLDPVKQNRGVERYKIVIDDTTTSQADKENNIVRGKIFIQPTRSVEFIAVDFDIQNTI